MSSPYFLSLAIEGTPTEPVFYITNPFGEYWSNDGWKKEKSDGRQFFDRGEVTAEMKRMLHEQYSGKPSRQLFMAPVLIEVMADTSFG